MKLKLKPLLVLPIIFLCFMAFGLFDGAIGVAWPSIRYEMGLPLQFAGFITITGVAFYSITTSQIGRLFSLLTTSHIVMIGISLQSVAALAIFLSPSFMYIIFSVAIMGTGMGLVDGGLNTYLTRHYTARHVNWGLCFWGMGATIGPIIMANMIIAQSWRGGYLSIFALQVVVGLLVLFSIFKSFWVKEVIVPKAVKNIDKFSGPPKEDGPNISYPLGYQAVQMGIFALIIGAQGSIGLWINSVMLESRGLSIAAASLYPTYYFASIMVGRFSFGLIAERYSNMTLIRSGVFLGFLGIVTLFFTTNLFSVALIGFGLAPIFPCLIHETSKRFAPEVLDKQIGYQLSASGVGDGISSATGFALAIISLEALFPIAGGLLILTFIANEVINFLSRKISHI